MSLIHEQAAFLRDVRKLLAYADEKNLIVTAGELQRAPEAQALHVKAGATPGMDSMHLRSCAIDLKFFSENTGRLRLVQTISELAPLGDFWERQDERNRWGGRRIQSPDISHFERDLGAWPTRSEGALAADTAAPAPMPSAGNERPPVVPPGSAQSTGAIQSPVLKRGVSNPTAITRLQDLLVKLQLLEKATGIFDEKTEIAVVRFQRSANLVSDGIVGEKTWNALTAQTGAAQVEQANRWLGDQDLAGAAEQLKLELPALKAVYKVESAGKGFTGDKPTILFEGHVFWRRLDAKGKNPATLAAGNGDILYPAWTREHYVGAAGEWVRLERAIAIDREAALESASYGLFQIMGEHWKRLGYDSVDDYVDHMCQHERDQLDAFCRFVTVNTGPGKKRLVDLLREKNWEDFARGYNGPRYRENRYDDKLRAAYLRYLNAN